jgi:hypothetical protein
MIERRPKSSSLSLRGVLTTDIADANAGEVGLEWLASNQMLFYAL